MKKILSVCLLITFLTACGSGSVMRFCKREKVVPNKPGISHVWNYAWRGDLHEKYVFEFYPYRLFFFSAATLAGNVFVKNSEKKRGVPRQKSGGWEMEILNN